MHDILMTATPYLCPVTILRVMRRSKSNADSAPHRPDADSPGRAVDPPAGAGYSPPLLPHCGQSRGENHMSPAGVLLLTLALALPGANPAPAAPDLPRLREMLYDRQA